MLVVIAIISILAGLLLPALTKSKTTVKIKAARMDMTTLIAAINQYESEYKRMPASSNAMRSLTANCPDFTFGTVRKGTDQPDGQISSPVILSTGNSGYQNCNSEVMNILRNANNYPNTNSAANPRRISFVSPKISAGTNTAGVGTDGVYRDPWGNPYIITLDGDFDDKCLDGFYRNASVSQDPGSTNPLKGLKNLSRTNSSGDNFQADVPVMIWSFGPDGKIDASTKANAGVNKDNILSWE